ncbi:hypothetical protein ACJJTC_015174 [Scirpophaga incertulas]
MHKTSSQPLKELHKLHPIPTGDSALLVSNLLRESSEAARRAAKTALCGTMTQNREPYDIEMLDADASRAGGMSKHGHETPEVTLITSCDDTLFELTNDVAPRWAPHLISTAFIQALEFKQHTLLHQVKHIK